MISVCTTYILTLFHDSISVCTVLFRASFCPFYVSVLRHWTFEWWRCSFFVYLLLCLCLFCLILLFDQVIMSVPTVRELNCSKSLGEIANLDFSVPVDCFAMYMLVSRYAGQSCHSSPTCRKTCLCMDRIHLSLQEMMTLKPVNEVDAIIKFMLFLCQVSSGMICCCPLLIHSRLFYLFIILLATWFGGTWWPHSLSCGF